MGERVRPSEAARRLGITRQAINGRIRRGTLSTAGGLVDLDEAEGVMAGAVHGATPEEVASYREARTLREVYNARTARLEYEKACGALIDARQAGAALTTAAASMRLALEALPDRLAARLAAEPDEAACAAILTAAVDEVLQALQDVAATLAEDVAA